jgi:hypothetical protein
MPHAASSTKHANGQAAVLLAGRACRTGERDAPTICADQRLGTTGDNLMSTAPPANSADRQWFIVGRWEEYDAEARANLLRIIGIAVFYAIHLLNYRGLHLLFLQLPASEDIDQGFHLAITLLAIAWMMVSLGVLLCLRRRFFPSSLKFVSTGCDLVLLTSILTVADGPRSPLVVGYFLILALAALRFSLPLTWFATAGSLVGYLLLLGYARWFSQRDLTVERYHELLILAALALCGIVLGQAIRRVRRMAEHYARRLMEAGVPSP